MDVGVDPAGKQKLSGCVDDPGAARNDEVLADHPDDVVFDVDVNLVGAIVVDDRPVLDEEPILSTLEVDGDLLDRGRLH